jgi:catechol 2,3-dioxygenase
VTEIDPGLRIEQVELAVSDLDRSVAFYERVLGFAAADAGSGRVWLSPVEGPARPSRPPLVLAAIDSPVPAPRRASGLFHVAWLHPTREALAASMRRVLEAGWRFTGASDHNVSEALYLDDPDGLGIELYADRPRETWEVDPQGSIKMVSIPLDVEDLLAQAPADPRPQIDPGTVIGHVHLKVADVDRAATFYADALGFELRAEIPSAAFLAAGGYHHHIAVNSWESPGAGRAPDDAPGLRRVRFALPTGGALDALEGTLAAAPAPVEFARANGELALTDPDGEPLTFAQA